MARLSFDCEELLHWWEPKSDISFIFDFNWRSLQQLREAITMFLTARLVSVARRATIAVTESGCPRLKSMLASNPRTPADMLDFLSNVSPVDILLRVAENPSSGKDTLSRLAFHEDPEVRAAVSENPNTPESCFKRLASDESVDVRYRLAENPHSPAAALYNLLKDENPYVAQRARQTLSRILGASVLETARTLEEQEKAQPRFNTDESVQCRSRQAIEVLSEFCGSDFVTLDFRLPESPPQI